MLAPTWVLGVRGALLLVSAPRFLAARDGAACSLNPALATAVDGRQALHSQLGAQGGWVLGAARAARAPCASGAARRARVLVVAPLCIALQRCGTALWVLWPLLAHVQRCGALQRRQAGS